MIEVELNGRRVVVPWECEPENRMKRALDRTAFCPHSGNQFLVARVLLLSTATTVADHT